MSKDKNTRLVPGGTKYVQCVLQKQANCKGREDDNHQYQQTNGRYGNSSGKTY